MREVFLRSALVLLLALPVPARALLMQIDGISDFNLPNWSLGLGDINASMDICVYALSVNPIGGYQIKVSSSGGYVLKFGTRSISYQLFWNDGGAGNLNGASTQLTNNSTLTGRQNASVADLGCLLFGPTARLSILIPEAQLTAALAGTYSGTITLLLSPP